MKIVITGGAGFIGSNLAAHLLNKPEVSLVRVLDNLATGSTKNIEELEAHPKFEFMQGDIRDYQTCLQPAKAWTLFLTRRLWVLFPALSTIRLPPTR
jgi:UDP-N-acetylglucosamine 4-epimerase